MFDGVYSTGHLQNKWPEQRNLVAMAVDSDTSKGGASRGSISRNYENDRNPSVYSYFERLFRPTLRGGGLPFRRLVN
jgi:hypothetical protein